MDVQTKAKMIALANSVIFVADKFIKKVDTGRAKSVETYQEMKFLKSEAEAMIEKLKTN